MTIQDLHTIFLGGGVSRRFTFFGDAQYPAKFHKQKLALHRASMKHFAVDLDAQKYEVDYREAVNNNSKLSKIFDQKKRRE